MAISPEEHQNLDATTPLGESFGVGNYVEHLRDWNGMARIMGAFFMDQGRYMNPTTAQSPVLTGAQATPRVSRIAGSPVSRPGPGELLRRSGLVKRLAMDAFSRVPFTRLANFSGVPARPQSAPALWYTIDGGCGSRGLLPCLAGELEQIQPWPLTASPRDGKIGEAA